MTAVRTYEVRHRTTYTYDAPVTASYGLAYLLPRDSAGQVCRRSRVTTVPGATFQAEDVDYFGNRSAYLEVHAPHTRLDVVSVSTVEVGRAGADLAALDVWRWEAAARAVQEGPGRVEAGEMLLPSQHAGADPAVAAFARSVLTPGRPLGSALAGLLHRINGDLVYRAGATSVSTPLSDVLDRREGVCQDFAHLAVACLRHAGLPARYVSGYLETQPPPGGTKLQGADASHAWVSVLVPDGSGGCEWVDLDPTNDQVVDQRYVLTAWGRDYADVPPLKGVIFTESTTSTLEVAVDVTPVADR